MTLRVNEEDSASTVKPDSDKRNANSWIANNKETLSILLKRRPEVRSAWLDNFIMSSLASADSTNTSDKENIIDSSYISDLFALVRELQLFLKLRKDGVDYHLNSFSPLVRVLSDKSSEVLPGSFSGTRKHLEFKLGVFKEIERKFPVIVDDRGFAIDTGYGHDVSRLLSLTGYVPREIGVRPISNLSQRVKHGLTNKIDPLFLSLCDDFLNLLYGVCLSRSVRMEGKSQSGLPLRLFGKGYKTISYMHAVNNLDDLLVNADDPSYLLKHYDVLYAFLQGSRQSPDSGGKKRYITTAADNILGLSGNTLQDNHPDLPNIPVALKKFFSTMRYRFVWGGNSISNSIVNSIATSCRLTYGSNYAFTFKHRGRDELLSKIKSFYGKSDLSDLHKSECDLVVIDVTGFDLDYPKDVLLKYVDYFKNTEIYDFFFRTAFAPSVQGTLDKFSMSNEPIVNGDIFNFDPVKYLNSGLPSGWSWVSDAGKIMALNIYYCLVKSKLLPDHSISQLDKFLAGELDYGCLNLGDDNVILCPHGKFDECLKALRSYSIWSVDLEPGARFIGFPLFFDSFGNFKITHDPASYVTNWLTPEREIGGKFTKYWAYGLEQRERVYSDVPIVHEFRKIIESNWKRVYGTDLRAIIHGEARKQEQILKESNKSDDIIDILFMNLHNSKNINLATVIIQDVIRDSSVLQWKWESQDIMDAFGLRLEDIENRPHVYYSEEVLVRSGYSILLSNQLKNKYYGDLFIHKNCSETVKQVILDRMVSSRSMEGIFLAS